MVVKQDHVHLIRPVDFPFSPGPKKDIIIHSEMLAGSVMGKQWKEKVKIVKGRNDFFNTYNSNMNTRESYGK